jgi:hypothetical protein
MLCSLLLGYTTIQDGGIAKEKLNEIYQALLHLAAALIAFRKADIIYE